MEHISFSLLFPINYKTNIAYVISVLKNFAEFSPDKPVMTYMFYTLSRRDFLDYFRCT